MPRAIKYLLLFVLGGLLGLFYIYYQQQPQRVNLESGLLWTAEETMPPTPTPMPPSIKLLFGGDLMFDRNIRLLGEEIGYSNLFSPALKQLLQQHDLVIANLEGPITDEPSVSVYTAPGSSKNFIFTFAPETAELLNELNIGLVNLGNNHIFNFGVSGAESTYQYLDQAGVDYFGWLGDSASAMVLNKPAVILDEGDFTLGFVNYNQFGNQDFSLVLQEVAAVKPQVDYLVIYPHWGIEYASTANAVIQKQARQLIEAGADLVIGAHPHVIQPNEDYLNGKIYYSLGNFVFDQYFSEEVKRGQLVQVELNRLNEEATPSASFKEFEVLMQRNQPVELVQDETVEVPDEAVELVPDEAADEER